MSNLDIVDSEQTTLYSITTYFILHNKTNNNFPHVSVILVVNRIGEVLQLFLGSFECYVTFLSVNLTHPPSPL